MPARIMYGFLLFLSLSLITSSSSFAQSITLPLFERDKDFYMPGEGGPPDNFLLFFTFLPLNKSLASTLDHIYDQLEIYKDFRESHSRLFKYQAKEITSEITEVTITKELSAEEKRNFPQYPTEIIKRCILIHSDQTIVGYSIVESISTSRYPKATIDSIKSNYTLNPSSMLDIKRLYPQLKIDSYEASQNGYFTHYLLVSSEPYSEALTIDSHYPERLKSTIEPLIYESLINQLDFSQ